MRKIIVIAMREFLAAVRTKAFAITLIAMPIMMGGGIVFQRVVGDRVDTRPKSVAVLDYTGRMFDTIAAKAAIRNIEDAFDDNGTQVKPKFLFESVDTDSKDIEESSYELSERVRSGAYFAYIIIGSGVIEPSQDPLQNGVNYYSNSPTYGDIARWLRPVLRDQIQAIRFVSAGLDPAVVTAATMPVNVENLGLVTLNESGELVPAQRTNQLINFFVPFGMIMLMFMTVNVCVTPLIQSVLEEKTNRIAEVLLGSVPPFSLMMGKLIGTVAVSLTLVTLYLGGGYAAVHFTGYSQYFPSHLVLWFVIQLVMLVIMFGSIFIAVGSAVSDFREAQSLIMPAYIFIIIPLMVWPSVVKEPSSLFATLISFFPPATPMLMLARQAVPPPIPLWQPILGIFTVLISAMVCVFIAGRIFRVGILMTGRGANIKDMAKWALRG